MACSLTADDNCIFNYLYYLSRLFLLSSNSGLALHIKHPVVRGALFYVLNYQASILPVFSVIRRRRLPSRLHALLLLLLLMLPQTPEDDLRSARASREKLTSWSQLVCVCVCVCS